MQDKKDKNTGANKSNPGRCIKNMHEINRKELTGQLLRQPVKRLIQQYFIEMDAKNEAYYFIIDRGLLFEFFEYCDELKS